MLKTVRFLYGRVGLLWAVLALLSGRALAQVANDDCSGAVSLTASNICTVPINGTVAGASQSLAPTAACGAGLTTATDVWYSFTATATSHLVTLAPRFAAILDVRSGTCTSSTSIFCTTIANNNTSAVPVGGLVSNQTYFIRVYPATNTPPSGISSTFALCIGQGASGPANDDCAGAIAVPVNSGICTNTVTSDNTGATASAGAPAPGCASYQGGDIWFTVTVPASGNVTVQTVIATTGNDIGDTGMSVYSGTCSNLTQLGCDDDNGGNLKSLLSYTGRTPGEVLYVRVWGYGGRTGSIGVCATTPAPLLNDNCAGAISIPITTSCLATVAGSVAGATQSLPPTPGCSNNTIANDVWFSFVASGATQILTFTGNFGAIVEVRSGTCAASTNVFCSTVFSNQPTTVTGLTSGQTYFLRLYVNGTFTPPNAAFGLCLTPGPTPATNDDCAGAIPLPVTTTCAAPVQGTVLGASQSLPPTANCNPNTIANDVWFSFVAGGATQTVTFAGNFGAVIDVRSGTCTSSASVFCGTIFTTQPLVVSGLTSGQTYFLRLYATGNFVPITPTFTLCLNPGPTPPVNDECAGAISLPIATSCIAPVSGTVGAASQSLPPTGACGFATTANDVWFSFVANGASQTLSFAGNFAAVIDVRSGTCASSTSLFCTTAFSGQQVIVPGLTSGQTYFLRVYANSTVPPPSTSSAFTLCLTAGPPPLTNDDCATAVPVSVVQNCTTSTNGTVYGASQSLPPTANCGTGITTAADVWYSFVAGSTSQLITLNPRFTAILDVRSGTCANSTSLFCTSVFAGNTTGTAVGGLTAGQTYFIRIYANFNTQPLPANATFVLCVSPAPTPPANDECAGAIAVPVTTTCATPTAGTVAAASQSLPVSTCGVINSTAADVWYSFVAGGTSQLITLNAQFAAVLEVRSGTCAASTSVTCLTVQPNATTGTAIGGLTAGQTYFIRIYANSTFQPAPINASFTVCVTTPPPAPINDVCTGALPVPVQFGATCVSQTSADNTAATASTGAPAPPCANYQGRDLWFTVTVPASGTVTVRTVVPTTGTDVGDTGMSMYSGTCGALLPIGCDDDGAGALKSLLTFTGRTPGEVLYIRVWAYGNSRTGTIAVCATSPTNCATPTTLAATNVTSGSAQLSWQPGGTAPTGVTYTVEYGLQGFAIGTGTVLSGLTTPGTQLTNLQSNTAYCFYVRQDCPGGNGSSAYAGPLCFTTPCAVPTNLSATAITATTALLSWQINGTAPSGASYTIEYGPQGFTQGTGTVIAGATTTSFSLSNLQASTAYCFYVRQDCPGSTGAGTFAGPVCFTTSGPSTTCLGPTALTAANLTQNSALLSWQPGGTPAPGTTYTVQYGLQGFALGTGITVGSLTIPGYSLTGLAATTGYCFYVRQNCPGTAGSSSYVGPVCFQTTTTAGGIANDEPCGAVSLGLPATNSTGPTLSSTTVGATTSAQPGIGTPSCSSNATPRDVWFTMTPATGVISVTLNLTGTAAGMVRVFTAPNCTSGPFTQVLCRSSGTNNTGLGTMTMPTVPGQTYYVAVSTYGAADTPGGFTITATSTVTATRPAAAANALLVYPNPSSTGQLTLKLSTAVFTATQVSLVNALGQVVRTETLRTGSTEQLLSTTGLATGIYTVRVVVGNDVLTRKVVLE